MPFKVGFRVQIYDTDESLQWSESLDFEIPQYTLCPLTIESNQQSVSAVSGEHVGPLVTDGFLCPELSCIPSDYHHIPKLPSVPKYDEQGPYYQQTIQTPKAGLAVDKVEECVLKGEWKQAIALLNEAADLIGQKSLFYADETETVEFAKRLLDYPFSELQGQGLNAGLVRCFAGRWSYCALMKATLVRAGLYPEGDLLALLLGKDYDLILDKVVATQPDLPAHSSSFRERSDSVPAAYEQISGLSYNARRCIAMSARYNSRGDVVKASWILNYLRAAFPSGIQECVGLSAVDP